MFINNIKMKGSRNSLKMSNDKMMCCCVVVVLILVGLYFLAIKNNLLEGFESEPMELNNLTDKPNPGQNEVLFVFFYADWCPHCVSAKPEWSKLVKKHHNTTQNGKNVKVHACNCEEEGVQKESATDNQVEGYPTIKCIKNNETVDYSGPREFESLEAWIKKMCN
jgi:thiol-disulfide isomerase/thioredoxin|tara:strand:- start:84 stop:578 length:495 start_codon:yes stop_codon:yes gene_type:complete